MASIAPLSSQFSTFRSRPEHELLLCVSRTCISTPDAERIHRLLKQEINWDYLVRTAIQQGVMPLLYWNLSNTCPEAVPTGVLSQLKTSFEGNAASNLCLTGELLNLLDLFEEQNIPAIPFKGPVLAASAYGNLALRQFGDLDISIAKPDIFKAKQLLLSQGYRLDIYPIQLTEAQEAAFVRSQRMHQLIRECAYPFVNLQNGIMVDLHWAVMPEVFSLPIENKQLWKTLDSVLINGQNVPNVSPENTLLILCGHGVKDCWPKLARICDIAELICRHPQLNWQQVVKEADRLGFKRALFLSLYLANHLLDTTLPDSVWQKMQTDPMAKRLATQVQATLFPEGGKPVIVKRITGFHLKVRERLQDKLCCWLRAAMTPTTSDWVLLPFAEFPLFLYYLIRPIRLLGKYGLRAIKRLQIFQQVGRRLEVRKS